MLNTQNIKFPLSCLDISFQRSRRETRFMDNTGSGMVSWAPWRLQITDGKVNTTSISSRSSLRRAALPHWLHTRRATWSLSGDGANSTQTPQRHRSGLLCLLTFYKCDFSEETFQTVQLLFKMFISFCRWNWKKILRYGNMLREWRLLATCKLVA